MKTYKGFNRNMTCRDFQYEEGKTYETENAVCCKTGFHGCEYPLDCFEYYNPVDSVFHEVEQSGKIAKNSGDSKISSTKIKIGPRLSITGLVKAAIDFTMSRIRTEAKSDEDYSATSSSGICSVASSTGSHSVASSTSDYCAASSTGRCSVASSTCGYSVASSTGSNSVASSTGRCSVASSTGRCSVASSTSNRSVASSTGSKSVASSLGFHSVASSLGSHSVASSLGECGAASSTGDYSATSSSGLCSAASSTGDWSSTSSSGRCSVASSTGFCSTASSGHETSIAVAWGCGGKAKGVLGSYIVLADWRNKSGSNCPLDISDWEFKDAKMIKIDGKKYKPNTWYAFYKGKIVEMGEDA